MVKGFKKNDGKGGKKFIPTDNKPTKGNSKKSPNKGDGSTGITRDEIEKHPVKEKIGNITDATRKQAEKHVGSEITDNPYGNSYEFKNGEEWLIFENEDDAKKEAFESLENLFDDLGISAWSDGFAEDYMEMSETDIRIWASEDGDRFVEDRDLDELKDMNNSWDFGIKEPQDDEPSEEAIDNFKEEISRKRSKYVAELLKEQGLKYYICDEEGLCSEDEFWDQYGEKWLDVDKEKLFQATIDADGIEHTLATYDHNEVRLGHNTVMYRTN